MRGVAVVAGVAGALLNDACEAALEFIWFRIGEIG